MTMTGNRMEMVRLLLEGMDESGRIQCARRMRVVLERIDAGRVGRQVESLGTYGLLPHPGSFRINHSDVLPVKSQRRLRQTFALSGAGL